MTDDTTKTDRIRRLNDLARNVPAMANATWMMTRGVNALLTGDDPAELPHDLHNRVAQLYRTIAGYDRFSERNDPHGEHDFGDFEFLGERLFFKLDYYHPARDVHSPDPANIELCRRVLTIMLAEEY